MKSLLSAIALVMIASIAPVRGFARELDGYLKSAFHKQIEEREKREKRERAELSALRAKRWKNYNRQVDVLERSALLIDFERALRAHHLSSIGEFRAADALLLRPINLQLANELAGHVPAQRAEALKSAGKKIHAGQTSLERVLDSICDVDANLQSAVSRGDRKKLRNIFHKRRHDSMDPIEYLKDLLPDIFDPSEWVEDPKGKTLPGFAAYEMVKDVMTLFKPAYQGLLNEICESAMNDRIDEDKRERQAREAAARGYSGSFHEGTSSAERRLQRSLGGESGSSGTTKSDSTKSDSGKSDSGNNGSSNEFGPGGGIFYH